MYSPLNTTACLHVVGFITTLALESQQLQDLTSLANLLHLSLPNIIHAGVPGVLPFQLVKLTFLQIDCCAGDTPEQLQHLSCLTALQELSVAWKASNHLPGFEGNVPGIEHLSKLLSLKVKGLSTITHSPDSSNTSTHSWARLTALKCLHLEECPVQLEVLATCTQLQALSLRHVQVPYYGDTAVTELSDAVSALSLLTKLTLDRPHSGGSLPAPSAASAAFTMAACMSFCHRCNMNE
jgi:hypothetical protein